MAEESSRSRVILGVHGMDTESARAKVTATLEAIAGIDAVEVVQDNQASISYDPSEVTIMDLIRALRKIGFLAGME